MQEIPAIIENRIDPPIGLFTVAPIKKPTIPTIIIMITEIIVLNFFICISPSQFRFVSQTIIPQTCEKSTAQGGKKAE